MHDGTMATMSTKTSEFTSAHRASAVTCNGRELVTSRSAKSVSVRVGRTRLRVRGSSMFTRREWMRVTGQAAVAAAVTRRRPHQPRNRRACSVSSRSTCPSSAGRPRPRGQGRRIRGRRPDRAAGWPRPARARRGRSAAGDRRHHRAGRQGPDDHDRPDLGQRARREAAAAGRGARAACATSRPATGATRRRPTCARRWPRRERRWRVWRRSRASAASRLGFHNHAAYIGAALGTSRRSSIASTPRWAGYYFDPRHAVAEGGGGAWKAATHLVAPRLKMVAVKDCRWVKSAKGWEIENCPLGEGQVDWAFVGQVAARRAVRRPDLAAPRVRDAGGDATYARRGEARPRVRAAVPLREATIPRGVSRS